MLRLASCLYLINPITLFRKAHVTVSYPTTRCVLTYLIPLFIVYLPPYKGGAVYTLKLPYLLSPPTTATLPS